MDIKSMLGDSDVTILAKFVEPQFVETTMAGNIYFARNKYFIELEEKETNKGIADKHEGGWSFLLQKGDQIILETDEEKLVLPVTPNVIHTRYDVISQIPICCFVYLSVKNDFKIVPNTNQIKLKPEVEIELRKQFKGRHLILFSDITKVLERFEKAAKAMDFHLARGLVEYFDEQNDPHPLIKEEYETNPIAALFYKSKFFEHQKEFRFVISKFLDNDVTVNVGNIKDIAVELGLVEIDKELPIEMIIKE
ncbi:hypothetical protein [Halalkalibacter nanhaiisediminis]|uniref:Uncharacterized protein n=1 Tax=Halalkalibacter nanhaiisediminis TaxID=688079 RepID=A0A562QJZ8_9BACI|nr:hypothetical protein [Halalkalibacter nanhaiisediminis]TWI57054.1 hypothetical protein IQ10_01756 [Halalkalibacter nanhaiisediminis]